MLPPNNRDERIKDIGFWYWKIAAYIASLLPDGSVVDINNRAEMTIFAYN